MSVDLKPRRTPPAKKAGGGTLFGLFIGLVIGMLVVAGVVWYLNKAPLPFTTTGQQPRLPPPTAGKGSPSTTPEVPPLASAPAALPGKPGDPVATEKPRFDFYKILPGKAEAIPDPKPEDPRAADAKLALSKPAEIKPIESRPIEIKPIESKPIEVKPSEVKPSEAKSAEAKAAEGKPAATKAADGKAAEGKQADSSRGKAEKDATLKEPIYLQAGSFQSAGEADNQKARLALMGAEARIQQVMLQDKVWYRVRLGPYNKMDEVNHLRGDLARQGIDANVVKKD
ncbi:Sporulation domain protein [Candidatus Accumulibacter aalborgensis]|uniref:Sporulation domain protein n=1 Tax=Candidatus Accumulibacter aalborgensis TaxID=1860102 RepID=A0A1A8XLX2_9PROT|nr:SPOR domain-containing protein [Candidatus Accumulibacter aalborgensis]SBT04938.1 Sporulation domain protein [Candidatus Accumulibacter aalborgensis]